MVEIRVSSKEDCKISWNSTCDFERDKIQEQPLFYRCYCFFLSFHFLSFHFFSFPFLFFPFLFFSFFLICIYGRIQPLLSEKETHERSVLGKKIILFFHIYIYKYNKISLRYSRLSRQSLEFKSKIRTGDINLKVFHHTNTAMTLMGIFRRSSADTERNV